MPAISIRPAAAPDAPALSAFAERAFVDTFGADNTPGDMARYVAGAFTPERQAAEIADAAGVVLLAESAGGDGAARPDGGAAGGACLVGYAHVAGGPAPAAVSGPAPLELKRLYVAAAWHGRGVAQALMDAALGAARARGAGALWLGVWERNARAARFYEKCGFRRVGEHTFVLGGDAQTDWLMARVVEGGAPPGPLDVARDA